MEQIADGTVEIPDRARQVLSLVLTILAAVLYGIVLGYAVVRTYLEGMPVFPPGMLRIAAMLSGMVGAVVTAGFAQSERPSSVPIRAPHPLGGHSRTGWSTLKPPSFLRCKFLGLARALGIHTQLVAPHAFTTDEQESQQGQAITAAVWVAALYFTVYFAVGLAAFALAVFRPAAPELILNSAWVWLGTVLSAGYSFFALGSQQQAT